MLDFYLLSDSQPTPNNLAQLIYAGGLEAALYDRLVKKGVINARYDYYSHFRWGNALVLEMAAKLKDLPSDTDVQQLKKIIEQAVINDVGLVAFGD